MSLKLFGGDPRYIYNQVLYKILLWYDVAMLPTLTITLFNDYRRIDTKYLPIPFLFFELLRLILNTSHTISDIPIYVAYLFICLIDLGIDLASIFVVKSTPFFYVIMFGYTIFHFIQLCWSVPVYLSFQHYQDAFYQFSQGKIRSQLQKQDNNNNDIPIDLYNM